MKDRGKYPIRWPVDYITNANLWKNAQDFCFFVVVVVIGGGIFLFACFVFLFFFNPIST